MKTIDLLPLEWAEYPNDYEKVFYDIELDDGKVFEHCYPNAGTFHLLDFDIYIKDERVKRFKVSKLQMPGWTEKESAEWIEGKRGQANG